MTDETISFGMLGTGPSNPLGYCLMACFQGGAQAYFDYRNSLGGVHGRQLEFSQVLDDEVGNNQVKALELVEADDVFGVFLAPLVFSGLADLGNAGMPTFTTPPASGDASGLESVFVAGGTLCTSCPRKQTVQAAVIAGATKVASLGLGASQASKDCANNNVATFEKWGPAVGIESVYLNDDLPFGFPNGVAPEVTAMKEAGVDYITTCIDISSALLLEQELERQGMSDVIVALPQGYGDTEFISTNAALLEGDILAVLFRPFEADIEGTGIETFLEWMDKGGYEVTDNALYAWIGAELAVQACSLRAHSSTVPASSPPPTAHGVHRRWDQRAGRLDTATHRTDRRRSGDERPGLRLHGLRRDPRGSGRTGERPGDAVVVLRPSRRRMARRRADELRLNRIARSADERRPTGLSATHCTPRSERIAQRNRTPPRAHRGETHGKAGRTGRVHHRSGPRAGRAHAVRLAQEGADIIAVDICQQMHAVTYPMSTRDDLDETVRQVEALGQRIEAYEADVRDLETLQKSFDHGSAQLGPVSIVVANAGIGPGGVASAEQQWDEVIGVNLTGVWNTGRVAIPSMIDNGSGGSIVLISSTGGLTGSPSNGAGMLGYTAAKHGVIGLMRSWANYLAPHFIRVNSVAPTTVRTPMANNGNVSMILQHVPALANSLTNAIPVEAVDAEDVANTVAWLASDDARYITGTVIPVDAGNVNRR